MSKAILVTGAAGFIGSHACKALARAGYLPVAYDDLRAGHREAVRWGPFVEADLGDRARLEDALKRHDVKAVMHFAASASVPDSLLRPELYFANNVGNMLILLETMRAQSVTHMVFSSSAAIYGTPDMVPIPEHAPKAPINPYGETKLIGEQMLHWWGEVHGFRHASLRYFNACGADPDGEIGEAHEPEGHLIPLVLDAAFGRRECIDIFGTDYATPDGTAVRDYIHVQDLAEAHVKALDRLFEGGDSGAFNLGTGIGRSVREVIAAAERVTGRKVPQREAPRRAGDPPVLVADPGRAKKLLHWEPSRSDLDTIVATALKPRLAGFAGLGLRGKA